MSIWHSGYSLEWFAEKPKDSLTCPICLQVLKDPHSCRYGHNFCRSCILKSLEFKSECPKCRIELDEESLTANLFVVNFVSDLAVICPNRDTTNCQWTGPLTERSFHKTNCPEVLIDCPLREWDLCSWNCTGVIRRGDLQNHVCKSVDAGVKTICDMNDKLTVNTYELKQFQTAAQATTGCITRAEADGTIYCGQVLSSGEKHGFGSLFRDDVCISHGNFVNNALSGNNCYLLGDDGSEYNGQMRDGLCDGTGQIVYRNLDTYEGQWKDGEWCGKGIWKKPIDRMEYSGDFADGAPHGKDGSNCEGDFSKGAMEGHGFLKSRNGETYTGDFKGNVKQGHGVMRYADGSIFEGNFNKNSTQGYGVFTATDGTVTKGLFRNGVAHGRVTRTEVNKNVFNGTFADGKANGNGTMHAPDDSLLYKGEFKDGLQHGSGVGVVTTLGKRCSYDGEWERGQPHGEGVLTSTSEGDKFRYSGSFVEGKRHGLGEQTYSSGAVYVGMWDNNQRHGHISETHFNGDKYSGDYFDDSREGNGEYTWANGRKYVGQWKNSKMHGEGTITYPDGTQKYQGQFAENKMHGHGVLTGPADDKYQYSGSFVDDKRHGHGEQTYATGTVYVGAWENDTKHGTGTETYMNGNKYFGDFVDDIRQGNGEYTWADGRKFVGQWTNNTRNGEGTITYPDGSFMHKGQFVDDKRHGHGLYTGIDGSKFEGQYVADQRASGKHTKVDGTVWAGSLVNDKFEGEVTISFVNGDVYSGAASSGMCCGKGVLTAASGLVIYSGEWQNNKYHGTGTLTLLANGTVYTGAFAKGVKHGEGTQTHTNGTSFKGQWKDGARHDGAGCETYRNGAKYVGDFVAGVRSGHGVYTFTDGTIFDGTWIDGHGSVGKRTSVSRVSWEGTWVGGKLQGLATASFDNGNVFVGAMLDGLPNGQGILSQSAGGLELYNGEWKSGMHHGKGMLVSSDRKWIYEGGFEGGLKQGSGKLQFSNGEYDGLWLGDKYHSIGTLKLNNGEVYDGSFVNGLKHGEGKQTFHNGHYTGQWQGDKYHGTGTLTTTTAGIETVYNGQFVSGEKSGTGKQTSSDGSMQNGVWLSNKLHDDKGSIVYANGDRFTGFVRNNEPHGDGRIMYAADGSVFVGRFELGVRREGILTQSDGTTTNSHWTAGNLATGHTTIHCANGDSYIGNMYAGQKSGQGMFKWANESIHHGVWVNDVAQGKGTLTEIAPDGTQTNYTGMFHAGKKHGKGTLTLPNGDVYTGLFKNDLQHGKGQLKRKGVRNLVRGEWVDGVLQPQPQQPQQEGQQT